MTTPTTTRGRVNSYFGVAAKDSTIRRELLADASTFLAMSYIVVVNPAILVQGGIPWYAAFTTTALVGGLATVMMGLWARLPFAVAPGMEINALVVFSVIRGHGFSWQAALGLVFWSGVVMVAVTGLGWRHRVIQAIPAEIRAVQLVLLHDLVEIYAGDTFLYDTVAAADQAERETAAAQRLFTQLPADQADQFRGLGTNSRSAARRRPASPKQWTACNPCC